MCQPLSAGGRRCPIHRHSSLAAAAVASNESGLNLRQVDNLFRELRREGRNAEPMQHATYVAMQSNLIRNAQGTPIETRVNEHITAAASETTADSATYYAQNLLVERARERGRRLNERFTEVAARTGFTTEEIAAKFQEAYNSVDVSRNADYPEEYSTTTRARAVTANLPYDRASVTALERIAALPTQQARERRIGENNWQRPTSNSHINRFAYDEGRLEIAFNNNPEQVFAYHDVPESVWEHLRGAQRPGRIYSHYIRGNQDYMYESAEAAEADAYRVRCESCGQFRAAVHTCPERETRAEVVASGVPVEHVAEVMEQTRIAEVAEAQDNLPDTDAVTATSGVDAFTNAYGRALAVRVQEGEITLRRAVELAEDAGASEAFWDEVVEQERATQQNEADLAYLRGRLAGTEDENPGIEARLAEENLANLPEDLRDEVLAHEISMTEAIDAAERRTDRDARVAEMAAEFEATARRWEAEEAEARTAAEETQTELESLYEQLAGRPVDVANDPVLNSDPDELAASLAESGDGEGEAEEVETPAPRARRTRRTAAQPEVGGIRPTDGIVVPEQGFQVADNQYERPAVAERTAPAAYGNFRVEDPEAPAFEAHITNADNQFNPQRFDTQSLVAYETTDVARSWDRRILTGGQDPRGTYGARYFTEADAQTIMDAPANMRFVMKTGAYGQPYVPVLAYDYHRFQVADGIRTNENGSQQNTLQLVRKPSVAENRLEQRSMRENPENYEADSAAWREHMMAEQQEFSRMREAGTLTHIPANASSSRRYVFDANLQQQPSISTAPVTEVRAAFRENKIVQVPMTIKFGREATSSTRDYVDDQGYSINPDRHVEISGMMTVRRKADGSIEVMNTERQLRCNCHDYRVRYYCKHLNYAQRHAGNVFQQMIPDSQGAGRTIAAPAAAGESGGRGHRLMSAGLRARPDTAVVVGGEGQDDYVRVTIPEGQQPTNYGYSYRVVRTMATPAYYRPADPDNPTPDEVTRLNEFRQTISELNEIRTPENMTPLRQAVRRSDVEVPVSANFYSNGTVAQVSGNVRVARLAEGDLTQMQTRERQLRCTCDVYQRNYDCRHVRAMHEQAYMIMTNGGRRSSDMPANSYERTMARYNAAMVRQREIDAVMNEQGVSRERAAEIIEERRAEMERLRAEREERRRQEQLVYERQRLEQARAEAEERQRANQETVDASAAYRERMKARWENAEEGYTANPDSFYEDYKEALRRKRAGEAIVPFRKEGGVTDGICADEPGARQFGIELEFDIKSGVNKREALQKIGRELHEAGLTPGANQVGYHSAGRNGYAQWSFENDCTVDAELVSPLMKDTPEHWEQLEKALEIIKRNGGIASTRTGSHVHVSTASYESSTAKHLELLRTVNNNDDILYRMASSPSRGRHRGMQWCAPNVNDDQGEISAEVSSAHNVLGYAHQSHNVGMNFQATYTPQYKKANVEFRMWDGTLDAAMIQQQVVMSAAITDYAERNVMEKGVSVPDRDKRLNVGNGKQREQDAFDRAGTQTHTPETFKAVNGHVGEFFDKILRRKEDRAAAAAMFAATSWQDRYR